jgi:hypothetical protein
VNANGLSVFNLLSYRQHDGAAALCAFDLIEREGTDLRSRTLRSGKIYSGSCCTVYDALILASL